MDFINVKQLKAVINTLYICCIDKTHVWRMLKFKDQHNVMNSLRIKGYHI